MKLKALFSLIAILATTGVATAATYTVPFDNTAGA
jgi:hypothetical protein